MWTAQKREEITVQLCGPVRSEKGLLSNSVHQSEVRRDYCPTLCTSLK